MSLAQGINQILRHRLTKVLIGFPATTGKRSFCVSLRQDYSQLAAETGLKRRTSWESVSLSSPQSLILFVNPQAKVSCFGISLDRLNIWIENLGGLSNCSDTMLGL
ncbi:hypothetical protein YC2023_040921 [Brassica napus]